jgi:hypothetical protein
MASLMLRAELAPPPGTLAQLTLTFDGEPMSVSLQETRRWDNKGLAGVAELQDPITTQLTPKLVSREGTTTFELTGYRLSEHEVPADTRVTMVLLIELSTQHGRTEQLSGYWYQDHQEVPTSMWQVEGTWTRVNRHAGSLSLVLFPVDNAGPCGAASGLIRIE